MTDARSRWVIPIVLAAVFLGGFAARFANLDARTMGHTESYVPGIALPDDYGEPRARLTLARAVINSMWEVHPPGWYALMWGWTKLFGTGLTTIRFPGVLLSALCILLLYRLASLEGNRRAGAVGAALLAFNGHQIYWAQIARPAAMLCCIGLGASVLLLSALHGGKHRRAALLGYGLLAWLGLVTEYYFWIFLATQILWNLLANWRDRGAALAVLRTQLLSVILASPIVTLAVFQSREAHFAGNFVAGYLDLLQIGFLFVRVNPLPYDVPSDVGLYLPWIGGALLALGLFATRSSGARREEPVAVRGPRVAVLALAAVAMAGAVFLTAGRLTEYVPAKQTKLLATSAVPLIALAAALVFRAPSGPLFRLWSAVMRRRGDAPTPLAATMAVVPALVIALATFAVPLFAARQMVIFVPYLLLVMGSGLVWTATRRPRPLFLVVTVALVILLASAHVRSYVWYANRLQSPHEYSELAAKWLPALREDDAVLVEDGWAITPLFYYVPPHAARFIPRGWSAALEEMRADRVWRIAFHNYPVPDGVRDALRGYRLVETVQARGVGAELWMKPASP